MRGRLGIILAVSVGCSLMLVAQYNILAQTESDQESPRAMIHRLQLEIEKIQARIAESPSSSETEELKKRIQWNKRIIKEILPGASAKIEGKAKKRTVRVSGLERYMVIAKKNLFTPLGSGDEVKRQEFVVTAIMGKMVLIQPIGEPVSFYVSKGESFGSDAKLIRIAEDSVTIIHEGREIKLKLGDDRAVTQPRSRKSGGSKGRKAPSRMADEERMRDARRDEEMRMREEEEIHRREQEEREHIARKIDDLHRERDEIQHKMMEMKERGLVDLDAHRRVEEIEHNIGDLESELR